MGIEIRLALDAERIDEQEWKNTYLKTLELIDNYPVMRLQSEYHRGQKRLVFTRQVEMNSENKGKRFWEICGNYETRSRGDSFKLYYDLNHYKKDKRKKVKPEKDEDILFAYTEKDRYPRYIFNSKTQGKDYQKLIIAVASLIEKEFPKAALMAGNIDQKEIKKAVKWAKQILNEDIKLPVLYDKNRLIDKLFKKYDTPDTIKMAYFNYLGGCDEIFAAIFDKFNEEEIKRWFKNYIDERFDKAGNPHAIRLYIVWLNITEDANTLLRMMCVEEGGPKFEPETFLKALASTWAFVPEKYFNSILKMSEVEAELKDSVHKQFYSFFWDAMMMGRKIKVSLDKSTVLQSIENLFPENKRKLKDIFKNKLSEIIDEFESENLTQMVKMLEKDEDVQKEDFDFNRFFQEEDLDWDQIQGEKYQKIINDIRAQIGKMREVLEEKNHKTLKEKYEMLIKLIYKRKNALREEAWQRLDNCYHEDVIVFLISIYTVKDGPKKFEVLRRFLAENIELLEKELSV